MKITKSELQEIIREEIQKVNEAKIKHPGVEKAAIDLAYSMPRHTIPDKDGKFTEKQIEKAMKKYSPVLVQASKQGMKSQIISRVQEILNESKKTFKSKVELENAIKDFKSKGFIEESVNEARMPPGRIGKDYIKFLADLKYIDEDILSETLEVYE
jgi:hypothetical protein